MTRRKRDQAGLEVYRRRIAILDRRLVLLLARRWSTVRATMRFKRSRHLPLFDPAQERRVLARARGWANDLGLSLRVVDRLFRSVIAEGRRQAVRRPGKRRPHPRRKA